MVCSFFSSIFPLEVVFLFLGTERRRSLLLLVRQMLRRRKSRQKVANGYKLLTKPMRTISFHILSISIFFPFRYKKWLNKSKVLDKELPDSRRNRSEDHANDDEISSAQHKPRMSWKSVSTSYY